MRKLRFLTLYLWIFASLYLFLSPPPAFAQPKAWTPNICVKDVRLNSGEVVTDVATIQGLECVFANIARIIVPVAGLALFIMLILGSFQLLTSAGEPKNVQKAWKTITYAVIGIVVTVGIWFVLKLIQAITGVDVTKFAIPSNPII